MSVRGVAGRSWWIGGIAGGGVPAAHWLTYRLLHAEGHLHETGHGHLGVTSAVAVAVFVAGAARFCAVGLRGGPMPGFASVAVRLTALQALAWVGLELAERAAAGALSTFDDHGIVLVGLGVQAALALVAAGLVRMGARVVEALVARRRVPRGRRPSNHPPLPQRVAHVVHAWGGQGVRGPPAPRALAAS